MLVDSRYSWDLQKNSISKWLRDCIKIPTDYDHFDRLLRAHFQSMKLKGFIPKVQQLEQLKIQFEEGENMPKTVNSKTKPSARTKAPTMGFVSMDRNSSDSEGGVNSRIFKKDQQSGEILQIRAGVM